MKLKDLSVEAKKPALADLTRGAESVKTFWTNLDLSMISKKEAEETPIQVKVYELLVGAPSRSNTEVLGWLEQLDDDESFVVKDANGNYEAVVLATDDAIERYGNE